MSKGIDNCKYSKKSIDQVFIEKATLKSFVEIVQFEILELTFMGIRTCFEDFLYGMTTEKYLKRVTG